MESGALTPRPRNGQHRHLAVAVLRHAALDLAAALVAAAALQRAEGAGSDTLFQTFDAKLLHGGSLAEKEGVYPEKRAGVSWEATNSTARARIGARKRLPVKMRRMQGKKIGLSR